MVFTDLLKLMVLKNASDLFITAGVPPCLKVDGKISPVTKQALTPDESRAFAYGIMNEDQRRSFEEDNECNFAIHPKKIGRFRVNVFMQQGMVGMVLRTIETRIPKFEELNLPPVLSEIALVQRGLVLFVGGTGTGKSTSLAALIGYRNENTFGHIITIEDPIEFLHSNEQSIVNQREVGLDTKSYARALKSAMRAAPDVIQIGEIRDRETADIAIQSALTGHLVFSTLHTNSAPETITRLLDMGLNPINFSDAFLGVLAQRLIRTLCTKCREEYHPSKEEFEEKDQNDLTDELYKVVYKHYKEKIEKNALAAFPVIKDVYEKQGNQYERIMVPFTDGIKTLQVVTNLKEAYDSNGKQLMTDFEKNITLSIIDDAWKNHLRQMDDLKQSVQNATYEQKDPLLIYKFEAFELFNKMLVQVNKDVLSFLFKGELPSQSPQQVSQARAQKREKVQLTKAEFNNPSEGTQTNETQQPQITETIVREQRKIGRNERVTIKSVMSGESKVVKYKQAIPLIQKGEWVLTEDD